MPAGLDPTGGIISAGAQGLEALESGVELFDQLRQEKQAKAQLKNLHDPFYQIQNEFYENRNLTGNAAQGGLPASTIDNANKQAQEGLGATISGELQAGGSPDSIGRSFSDYGKFIDNTASEDAKAHMDNLQYFLKANSDLAGEKVKQWAINQYKPEQDKKAALTEAAKAAGTNAATLAGNATSALGGIGTSLENNALLAALFKNRGGDNQLSGGTKIDTDGPDNASFNPSMANSTGFIDPLTPNLIPNVQSPFQ